MAVDVTIPRLGWAMEEGVFAGWLKKPGDAVKPGEPLFMLEGEKATQEVEALDGGVLYLAPDAPAAGETVLVGRTIGMLCGHGETPTWTGRSPSPPGPDVGSAEPAIAPAGVPRRAPAAPAVSDHESSHDAAVASGERAGHAVVRATGSIPVAASPTVRRLARQMGIDLTTVSAGLPGGRLSVEDLTAHARDAGAAVHPMTPHRATSAGNAPKSPRSSPRARRAARQRGIDIATVRGGGAGGRIRERDVLAVAVDQPAAGISVQARPGGRRIPITPTRRTIARQMVRSRQETVPVMLTAWADATSLLTLRAENKAAAGPEAPTFNDMLLKALADTLVAHPLLAARWEETHLSLPGERIDVGLAVDAPGGLVVPVVRDVAASPLIEVARQTRSLVERARAGRLVAADMQGGVFTLTSLGSYGVEFFTPVINHPEAAILGVGALRTQPVPPLDGREGVVFTRQLPLSLTFDHRIVDGGPAARFLGDLVTRIESFGAR